MQNLVVLDRTIWTYLRGPQNYSRNTNPAVVGGIVHHVTSVFSILVTLRKLVTGGQSTRTQIGIAKVRSDGLTHRNTPTMGYYAELIAVGETLRAFTQKFAKNYSFSVAAFQGHSRTSKVTRFDPVPMTSYLVPCLR